VDSVAEGDVVVVGPFDVEPVRCGEAAGVALGRGRDETGAFVIGAR
jgi:hypothetical protein